MIDKPPDVYSVLEEKKIKEPNMIDRPPDVYYLLAKGVKPKKEPTIIKTLPVVYPSVIEKKYYPEVIQPSRMINPISSTLIEEKTYQPRVLSHRLSFEPPLFYRTHPIFSPFKGSEPDIPSTIRRVPRVVKPLNPYTIQPPFKK